MGISATITKAAATVTAIGTVGGGAVYLNEAHAPMSMVSKVTVMELFDLVEIAQRDGPEDWICRAIDEQIIQLCEEDEDHYLCRDPEAADKLREKAGCD